MTISLRNLSAIVAVALVLAATPAILRGQGALSPTQDASARNAEVAKLIAVLQSDAIPFDKAKACQRLALIGTKEAVPALAALLADEKLSSYARFGLEPIPDPSVDDVLRDALRKLHGQFLVGVPAEQRLGMYEEAFRAAQRDEERRLVLAVLGHIPTTKAMSMVLPHLGNPALAEEAAATALAIGEKTVQTEPRMVADAMRQVLKSGVSGEKAARAKKLLERASS